MQTYIQTSLTDILTELTIVRKPSAEFTVIYDELSETDKQTYNDFINVFTLNSNIVMNNSPQLVEIYRITTVGVDPESLQWDYNELSEENKIIYNNFLNLK